MATNQDDRKPLKDLDSVMKAVEDWREKAFVVGVATVGEIPTGHKVAINVVMVDPDEPQATFPTGGSVKVGNDWVDLIGLGKVVIERIAQAAGLDWIPEMSGRIDDGRNPDKIAWQKTCSYTDLTGAVHSVTASYEMDFDAREQELLATKGRTYDYKASDSRVFKNQTQTQGDKFKAENPNRQKWIEEAVRADILRMKSHGVGHAETGAMTRAVISALGLRRGGYTAADLRKKPFAVFRLVDDIDWQNDPAAHGAQILRASGLAKALAFGGARQSLINALLPRPVDAPTLPAIAAPAGAVPAQRQDAPVIVAAELVSTTTHAETKDTKPAGDPETLPTVEEFAKLDRPARESLVQHLVATRVREKMPANPIASYKDDTLATWYATLVACPLKDGGASTKEDQP